MQVGEALSELQTAAKANEHAVATNADGLKEMLDKARLGRDERSGQLEEEEAELQKVKARLEEQQLEVQRLGVAREAESRAIARSEQSTTEAMASAEKWKEQLQASVMATKTAEGELLNLAGPGRVRRWRMI